MVLAVAAILVVPEIETVFVKGRLVEEIHGAQMICLAARQAVLDAEQGGSKEIGYPADIGIRSQAAYLGLLVKNGYLKPKDLKAFHAEHFAIANVSKNDPPETIFVISRSDDNPWNQGTPQDRVIVHAAGDGASYRGSSRGDWGPLPPRTPAFLDP